MQNLLRNIQFASRQLIKAPMFTLTAALMLALGIGANTSSSPSSTPRCWRPCLNTLYGVGSVDYTAIVVAARLLLGASLLASWLPARGAAAVEPMHALSTEQGIWR
jgi:ABC-type lipoprotein release transport system permease subunit